MKYIISFIFLLCGYLAGAQSILPLRADTVVIEKTGGSGELKIKNSTRDSLGLLVNIGGGKTRFLRARALTDSTVIIGLDTITIKGGAGGGGGVGTVTQVNTGLWLSGGPITSSGTIISDSAGMANYFLRRKDSTLYTTVTRLSDTAAALRVAIGAGGGNALDKTKIDLGRLPIVKQRYPAQGVTATGTTVTNYPIAALDSNAYPFTTTSSFTAGTKYGGVLWATPVGDSMRITAPFGVATGSSFMEGHNGLHGRLHWLLSGVAQGTFNPTYPDSVGQVTYHLRELTGYRWYNHGIGGQTSRQTWLRWMRDVAGDSISGSIDSRGSRTLSRKPYIVIYDGVGNDPYFGLTPDDSKMYLEFMAKWCQDNGVRFIVCNSPTGLISTVAAYTHLENVNKWLEDGQLDKYGTVVFDLKRYWSDPAWNYDGIHMRPDVSSDGIHFTKAGYDSLSRWIFEACKIPKITGIGIVNNLAPTNPVTNFAYTSGFTVQGTPYTMGSQSAVLPLLAPLTSDSVWVKATSLTTVAGAGTQYGYGHWYWQLDNNLTNDSFYTRKTNGSNSAQSNTPKITKMEIWPANHLNNELVLDIKNAANDNSSFRFLTGNYPKALFNTTTELGTGSILSIGNAGQATSIHAQGHLKVDGTTNYIGWLEILRGTGLPTTLGRGIAINGTGTEFAFYSGAMANKDQFSFGDYTAPGTIPLRPNPTAIVAIKQTGFGNANASNQIGNVLSLKPTYNQTDGAQLNIAFRGIYYNPILTSLTNTRHYGAFLVSGNNYFNIVSDSTCFGCDSTESILAKFRVKGSVRLDGQLTGTNTMKLLVKGSDSLIYQVDPSAASSAAGVEGSVQYKIGSSLAGNSDFKRIDSVQTVVSGKFAADNLVRSGDTTYNFKPTKQAFFFGNSITARAFTPAYLAFSTRVANGMNLIEVNYAIGGTRMVQLSAGDSAMEERRFRIPIYDANTMDLLVFGYGTNDWRTPSVDSAVYRAEYNETLDSAIIHRGWPASKILVVTPGYSIHPTVGAQPRNLEFVNITKDLAAKKGVKYVDAYAAMQEIGLKTGLNLIDNDSTHLNEQGNAAWALAALDTLNSSSGDIRAHGGLYGRQLTIMGWGNDPHVTILDSAQNPITEFRGWNGDNSFATSQAWGLNALDSLTTGTNNNGFGERTLGGLTTGSGNTAGGSFALRFLKTGSFNTAYGYNAAVNWTGSNLTAVGANALQNATGSNNAAFGYNAAQATTTASRATALGTGALAALTTGDDNTAGGYNAGASNTTGSSNTYFGSTAGLNNTTSQANTAVGSEALTGANSGFNTAIGRRSMRFATGSLNTALGAAAFGAATSGTRNVSIGFNNMGLATTSSNNTSAGYSALDSIVASSTNNTALGYEALHNLQAGNKNTAIGHQAALNCRNCDSITVIGGYQFPTNTATSNVAVLSSGGVGMTNLALYKAPNGWTGFGTDAPLFRVHSGGKLGIDSVSTGTAGDSVLVINNKEVKKVASTSSVSIPTTRIPIGSGAGVYHTSSLVFDSVSTIKKRLHIGGPQGGANLGEIHLGGSNGSANNVIFYYGQGVQESNSALVNLFAPTYGFSVGVGSLSTSVSTRFTVTDQEATVKTNLYIDSITTGASTDSILVINSREVKKISGNDLARQVINAGTTDFTITIGALTVLPSLAGAANRTITLPAASSHTGKFIFLWNKNADANLWSFGSTYTDPNGTTASTIANGSYSAYQSTGSEWLRIQNN